MKPRTLILLLVMAFLGGLTAYIISVIRQAEPATQSDLYVGTEPDAKLLELDKQALDEAYHQHLIRLWNVWLSDGARVSDRISTGLRIARQSYHQAAAQIAEREKELPK